MGEEHPVRSSTCVSRLCAVLRIEKATHEAVDIARLATEVRAAALATVLHDRTTAVHMLRLAMAEAVEPQAAAEATSEVAAVDVRVAAVVEVAIRVADTRAVADTAAVADPGCCK